MLLIIMTSYVPNAAEKSGNPRNAPDVDSIRTLHPPEISRKFLIFLCLGCLIHPDSKAIQT